MRCGERRRFMPSTRAISSIPARSTPCKSAEMPQQLAPPLRADARDVLERLSRRAPSAGGRDGR